jgi:hypothetical protein
MGPGDRQRLPVADMWRRGVLLDPRREPDRVRSSRADPRVLAELLENDVRDRVGLMIRSGQLSPVHAERLVTRTVELQRDRLAADVANIR